MSTDSPQHAAPSTPTPAPAPLQPPPASGAVTAQAPGTVTPSDQVGVKIVSHSSLFYWWPVWAVGLMMAFITLIDNHRVAFVPGDTDTQAGVEVPGFKGTRAVLVFPPNEALPTDPVTGNPIKPYVRMAQSKSLGVIFVMVLLVVIVITNVPLRGLWSVVVIVVLGLMAVIFALAGWWEHIFYYLSVLAIHINMGGYLVIALVLFALWLATVLLFDRQIYMIFTPGQLRVCEEIGGAETAYDTMGMVIQKHRDDLFRHWILGLGSGDLIVRTSGAQSKEFNMHNVLFIGHKLKQIEEMQRDRPVVRGGP